MKLLGVIVGIVLLLELSARVEKGECLERSHLVPRAEASFSSSRFGSVRILWSDDPGYLTGLCSGVIISQRSILTAKHCVDGEGKMTIHTSDFHSVPSSTGPVCSTELGGSPADVEEVVVNPDADLALIQLRSRLEPRMTRGCTKTVELEQEIVVEGFGLVNGSIGGPKLSSGRIIHLDRNEIWVAYEKGGSCRGDSGGGLFVADGTLVGILSQGNANCEGADRFVRLDNYRQWVLRNLL
jgi:S1-C subfamily serine protease